jgi:hypothetical protein
MASANEHLAFDLAQQVLGKTAPRVFTAPLVQGPPGPCGCGCALDDTNTLGFAVEEFARDILGRPLFRWQRWLVIHAMELLSNDWPRFRQVLVLVGRQNGKTELCVILSLFWLWVQQVPMVLGTSTKLDYSRISWKKAIKLARATADLRGNVAVRKENGKEELKAVWDADAEDESVYKIAASNEEGGRSLTIHRLIEDELRQHHDYSAHDAAKNAMNAVDDGQAWAITNEGDDRAVVLHDLHDDALLFIAQGQGDLRLGLFSYSAEPGCDLLDVEQAAQSNPSMGEKGGVNWLNLVGDAKRAALKGGAVEAGYRTEVLCQRVRQLRSMPISLEAWAATSKDIHPDPEAGETWPDPVPDQGPAFFVVVGEDQTSAAIAVAGGYDGRPHVEYAYAGAPDGLVARAKELAETHPLAPWGAFNAGQTRAWSPQFATFNVELKLLGVPETVAACAHLQRLANLFRFTHSPNQSAEESLAGAERRKTVGGGWVWDWEKSTSDLTMISAATGALWLLESVPTYKPAFAFSA